MIRRLLIVGAALLSLSQFAQSEPVQIDGPFGPLQAELVQAKTAQNIVVIVPGSGATDRDGNASGTYRLIAQGLSDAGISSLRIDKRGLFGSRDAIPDPNAVTIADYVEDLRKWVVRAAKEAPCVWVAGHSEGGIVALEMATQPPKPLCGLILLATPGRPVDVILIEQLENRPENGAFLPEAKAILEKLKSGARISTAEMSPELRPLFHVDVQGYWIDLLRRHPTQLAARWFGPTLIVQGSADIQVSEEDAELLAGAMKQAERLPLSSGSHMLKTVVSGQPLATYRDPKLPLHPDLLPGIIGFIRNTNP